MNEEFIRDINSYLTEVSTILGILPISDIARAVNLIEKARKNGNSIFLFGNGGSAATASHIACDLSKGTICSGKQRIKAIALTDQMPLLLAWANDSSYDHIFDEQLKNLAMVGDIAIAISGSGNSSNVLNGVRVAKTKGVTTIGFIGFEGGKLRSLVDLPLVIPCFNMEQVEDVHLLLGHIITTCLKKSISTEPALNVLPRGVA